MKLDKIVFTVTTTVTRTLTMSSDNGYVMPVTPNELIETVNQFKNSPESFLSNDEFVEQESSLVDFNADVIEV